MPLFAIQTNPLSGEILQIVEDDSYENIIFRNEFAFLILEIPNNISHWDHYELNIFYQWVLFYKFYIPANFNELIDEWINGQREEQLKTLISIYNTDISCIQDITDQEKCMDLLEIKVERR